MDSEILSPKYTKFKVQIKTNAKKDIVTFDQAINCLVVHVKAKRVHGKANKVLISILEKVTGHRCALVKGFSSRNKIVEIYGDREEIIRSITSQ